MVTIPGPEVKPRPDVIRQSLYDFYGACPPDLWVYAWVLNADGDGGISHWFRIKDLDEMAAFVATAPPNCYWPVSLCRKNLGPKRRCKIGESAGILGLWTDIDIHGPAHKKENLPTTMDESCELAQSLGIFPTRYVATGHGLQLYWRFKEPWIFRDDEDRAKAEQLVSRWHGAIKRNAQAAGWTLDGTHDLARLLRIPGSVNIKPDCDPVLVEFLNEDGRRYTIEELAAVVEPEEEPGEEGSSSSVLKISAVERCRRYVAKMPPAISRQRGHDACFDAARTIFVGFALSESEGRPILYEYNRRCQPPWSDKELDHKIAEAIHKSRLPPGYLLDKSPSPNGHSAAQAAKVELPDPRSMFISDLAVLQANPDLALALLRILDDARAKQGGNQPCAF
jgi:hypothetical protein